MRFCIADINFNYDISANPYSSSLWEKFREFEINDDNRGRDIQISSKVIEGNKEYLKTLKKDAWDPLELENGALQLFIINTALAKQCIQIHSAVVVVAGMAFAFSGPSGIGKSTQVSLWRNYFLGGGYRVYILNGDKAFYKRLGGHWEVYGTPWKGKENIGINGHAPLKGICFLSKGRVNKIRRLTDSEAVDRILRQTYFPRVKDDMILQLDLVDQFVKEVPCFFLECTISDEAVELTYKAMSQRDKE